MARYTVIRDSNMVAVNGEYRVVDCSNLPSYFHALQWYGDAPEPYGEIEYAPDQQGRKMPNTQFSDFETYMWLVDAWQQAEPMMQVKDGRLVNAPTRERQGLPEAPS